MFLIVNQKAQLHLKTIDAVVDKFYRLLVDTLVKTDRLLTSMWTDFSSKYKKLAVEQNQKNVLQFMYKSIHM